MGCRELQKEARTARLKLEWHNYGKTDGELVPSGAGWFAYLSLDWEAYHALVCLCISFFPLSVDPRLLPPPKYPDDERVRETTLPLAGCFQFARDERAILTVNLDGARFFARAALVFFPLDLGQSKRRHPVSSIQVSVDQALETLESLNGFARVSTIVPAYVAYLKYTRTEPDFFSFFVPGKLPHLPG